MLNALTLLDSQIAKLGVDIDNEYEVLLPSLPSNVPLTKDCNSSQQRENTELLGERTAHAGPDGAQATQVKGGTL